MTFDKQATGILADIMIKTKAFQYSSDKPFQLAAGGTSPYYFDLRLLNADPQGISEVARILYNMITEMPDGIKSVGGLESGSISMATAVSQYSYIKHEQDNSNPLITSFFVRKQQKSHGTLKRIEGIVSSPCVILDDVITSGQSALTAVDVVEAKEYECKSLICILFRGTNEQQSSIEERISFQYIFHKDEFFDQTKTQTQ